MLNFYCLFILTILTSDALRFRALRIDSIYNDALCDHVGNCCSSMEFNRINNVVHILKCLL